MLEYRSLWLSAPTTAWPPGVPRTGRWLRHVLVADTRDPAGHVAVAPSRWWPWPASRRVAIYEGPDASLLFTAKRVGWLSPVTVVAEADGNVVALIYGRTVASAARRFLARRAGVAGWQAGSFVNRSGADLVRWEAEGAGTVAHFNDELRNEPFVKMGLLAAILMHG